MQKLTPCAVQKYYFFSNLQKNIQKKEKKRAPPERCHVLLKYLNVCA
jgi:hypothetical protein